MTNPPVTELRLVVTAEDYDEALHFYRDVLGLPEQAAFSSDGGRVVILDAGRATLEITDPAHAAFIDDVEVGQRVAGHIRVAFEVADSAVTTRQLVEAGAGLIAEPTSTPWGSRNARLAGPAGLQLTLFSDEAAKGEAGPAGDDLEPLLQRAAGVAERYRAQLPERHVAAHGDAASIRAAFGGPLPTAPRSPGAVVEALVRAAEPGLVATAGPRFFGFVIGGALEAATAAEVLTAGWDQCAFNVMLSPAAMAAEEAAGTWLKALLGIPPSASVGFVTGGQEANTVGLAAARHHVLAEAGWDVEQDGLAGGPAVRVVAGAERHGTIDRSLRLLGFGAGALEAVAVDRQGAIDVADLDRVLEAQPTGPTIVCLQAGNVNTGACDDLRGATEVAHRRGAWVHVDGAFGLWAAASPATRHLVDGVGLADSWACDGHKWLNVPYGSGFAFCSRPEVHAAAVSYTAAYLTGSGSGVAAGADLTLGSSRRTPGFAAWAALQQLGRDGIADLVDRCCALARRFAAGLADGGLEIVNDVVLNQVLAAVGDDAQTDRVIEAVQAEGTCWLGGTTWRGRRLLRISVSNWSTTTEDVDRSVAAILRIVASGSLPTGAPGPGISRP